MILSFDDFINESKLSRTVDWPENWKEMGEWSILQDLGFQDATTPQMLKNGNILLINERFPLYPHGIVLQRSGYIRDKGKTSGFIKKYSDVTFSLKMMLNYLIERFQRETRKYLANENQISVASSRFLDSVCGKNRWVFNSETGKIDVPGRGNAVDLSKLKKIPAEISWGDVESRFSIDNCGLESLEGKCPDKVGGSFSCAGNRLKTLEGCPSFVGEDFFCENNPLENLLGIGEAKRLKTTFFDIKNFKGVGDFLLVLDCLQNKKSNDAIRLNIGSQASLQKAVNLLINTLSQEVLDDFYSKNPLLLYQLNDFPDLKQGILDRTGIRDFGEIGKALHSGVI